MSLATDITQPISLLEFQRRLNEIHLWANQGCGDGGCCIRRPTGMHTNGGCRCTPHAFSEALLDLASQAGEHRRYRLWPKTKPNDC